MQTARIDISAIIIGERLREIDADYVALIAESFEANGQFAPIHVTKTAGEGEFALIAGAHRLDAAKSLGWSAIDALIFSGDELQAELLQIDENLMRRELSELDRGTFLARRKAVYEELHPETKHGGARVGSNLPNLATCFSTDRFTKVAARKMGVSERVVNRAVARFAALAPDVRKAIGHLPVAAKGIDLDALAAYPVDRQRAIAAELTAAEKPARSVREAGLRLGFIQADKPADVEQRRYEQARAAVFALPPVLRRKLLREMAEQVAA